MSEIEFTQKVSRCHEAEQPTNCNLLPSEITGPSAQKIGGIGQSAGIDNGLGDPPVDYNDTSGIDRRRFYIPQPNNYSCAPTSLTEALYDFNANGGTTGLHFDGDSYANPNTRWANRAAVERAVGEPQNDFGSIDEEAQFAAKFGLATKLHFDPDSGVTLDPSNVDKAMGELDAALQAGHGAIINVPHHFVYCAGKTADGQYIMGDPADRNTSLWNRWRMANEMDHEYDPFNENNVWTPRGFVEVWNPDKPVHDHIVSLGYPVQSETPNAPQWSGVPNGQRVIPFREGERAGGDYPDGKGQFTPEIKETEK